MLRSKALLLTCLFLIACGDSGSGGAGAGAGDTGGTTNGTGGKSSGGGGHGGQGGEIGTGGLANTGGAGGSGGSSELICPAPDTDIAEVDLGGGADPEAGDFTLDEALDGLPEGPGPLRAIIETDLGAITCALFPELAPNGVANFVGLARGRRPFRDPLSKHWIKGKRFYDGLKFHRVIDNFVAQGGDPLGTGFGDAGYKFDDEISAESHLPGTLAYANAGPNTNGSQFYIVAEVEATFLDGGYTIFGRCSPIATVQALTEVPTNANNAPVEPLLMNSVTITRCAP